MGWQICASLVLLFLACTWADDRQVVEKTNSGVAVHEKHKSSVVKTKEDYYKKNGYQERQIYLPYNSYQESPNQNILEYFLVPNYKQQEYLVPYQYLIPYHQYSTNQYQKGPDNPHPYQPRQPYRPYQPPKPSHPYQPYHHKTTEYGYGVEKYYKLDTCEYRFILDMVQCKEHKVGYQQETYGKQESKGGDSYGKSDYNSYGHHASYQGKSYGSQQEYKHGSGFDIPNPNYPHSGYVPYPDSGHGNDYKNKVPSYNLQYSHYGWQDNSYSKNNRYYGKRVNSYGNNNRYYGRQDNSYGENNRYYGWQDNSYGKNNRYYGWQDNSYSRNNRYYSQSKKYGNRNSGLHIPNHNYPPKGYVPYPDNSRYNMYNSGYEYGKTYFPNPYTNSNHGMHQMSPRYPQYQVRMPFHAPGLDNQPFVGYYASFKAGNIYTKNSYQSRVYHKSGEYQTAYNDFQSFGLKNIVKLKEGKQDKTSTSISTALVGQTPYFNYEVRLLPNHCTLQGYSGRHTCISFTGKTHPYEKVVRLFVYVSREQYHQRSYKYERNTSYNQGH